VQFILFQLKSAKFYLAFFNLQNLIDYIILKRNHILVIFLKIVQLIRQHQDDKKKI
jgi:hypothetical protein